MQPGKKSNSIVVFALSARTSFGKLLRRVEDEHRSLVIEKRGTPKAVLLSIRDYVRLAAPEPEVLRIITRNRSARGRINSRLGRLTKSSSLPAPRNPRADDCAPAVDRHQHRCLGSPQTGRTPAYPPDSGDHEAGNALPAMASPPTTSPTSPRTSPMPPSSRPLPATPLPNRPARAAAAAEAVTRHVCASLLNSRCCARAHSQGGTTVTV